MSMETKVRSKPTLDLDRLALIFPDGAMGVRADGFTIEAAHEETRTRGGFGAKVARVRVRVMEIIPTHPPLKTIYAETEDEALQVRIDLGATAHRYKIVVGI